MAQFDYSDITYYQSETNKRLMVCGEVKNSSGRNYNALAIRIILFNKNIPLANMVIVINGFSNGAIKRFEKEAEELDYEQVAKHITRYELYTESAY